MMLGSTRAVRVFALATPVDMRKSFDTLTALVTSGLQRSALSGDVFLFVGRDRKRAKILYFDGTGLCLLAKRLERGHFMAPWRSQVEGPMAMTVSELALFLEGSRLEGRLPLSPEPFVPKALI